MSPRRRIGAVIGSLLSNFPFYGTLALRLPVEESDKVQTMAADGVTLFYNPQWVADTPADDLKFCVARLVTACALKHHTRRGERDHGKWQKASLYASTPMVTPSVPLPQDVEQTPSWADELSAEQIYDRLPDSDESDDKGDAGGQVLDYPALGGDGDSQDTEPAEGEDEAEGGGSPQDTRASDQQRHEQDWDEAVHQAAQSAKTQGFDPGGMAEKLDEAHQHKLDWRDILREFMLAVVKSDYTWTFPNRRHIDTGLYLPSIHGQGMPPVAIAIDTSGSVDTATLDAFWAEIVGIAEETHPEAIHVVQCDAQVSQADEYGPDELPDDLTVYGRGGTMFSPAFEYVNENVDTPACLIYLTDGYCYDFGPEPDYPVLWCLDKADDVDWFKPPFGETVGIDIK